MAKTVIGLFQDSSKAQQIVHALADAGFRREDIRTLTSQEGASTGTLTAVGVPEPEAQEYADGARRGGTVVLVDAADERTDQAVAIMEREAAPDVEAPPAPRAREPSGRREVEAAGDVTIPVVEEALQAAPVRCGAAACGSMSA